MDRDDDGETSYKYNTFVDDVAFEPTYLQALPTAAGRNVATRVKLLPNAGHCSLSCVNDKTNNRGLLGHTISLNL